MSAVNENDERISTGLPGLDNILKGGLDPNRLYLVEGAPGSGNPLRFSSCSRELTKEKKSSTSHCPKVKMSCSWWPGDTAGL